VLQAHTLKSTQYSVPNVFLMCS